MKFNTWDSKIAARLARELLGMPVNALSPVEKCLFDELYEVNWLDADEDGIICKGNLFNAK